MGGNGGYALKTEVDHYFNRGSDGTLSGLPKLGKGSSGLVTRTNLVGLVQLPRTSIKPRDS